MTCNTIMIHNLSIMDIIVNMYSSTYGYIYHTTFFLIMRIIGHQPSVKKGVYDVYGKI